MISYEMPLHCTEEEELRFVTEHRKSLLCVPIEEVMCSSDLL